MYAYEKNTTQIKKRLKGMDVAHETWVRILLLEYSRLKIHSLLAFTTLICYCNNIT